MDAPKFPSITDLSHKNLKLSSVPFYVEEKIDGSHLSFRLSEDSSEILFFNRNKQVQGILTGTYEKAVTMIPLMKDKLQVGFMYYGEYVKAPKANVVVYDRTPPYFFILYDVYDMTNKNWFSYAEKVIEAERVGLMCVPLLYMQKDDTVTAHDACAELIKLIESNQIQSCLGGVPEGVVAKRGGAKFKMVSSAFKERHKVKQPKHIRLFKEDYLAWIGAQFDVEARYQKARQHLTENSLELTKENMEAELDADLYKERRDEINSYIRAEAIGYIKRVLDLKQAPPPGTQPRACADPTVTHIMDLTRLHRDPEVVLPILYEEFRPIVCGYARTHLQGF